MIDCGLGVKFSGAFDDPYLVILEVLQDLFMQRLVFSDEYEIIILGLKTEKRNSSAMDLPSLHKLFQMALKTGWVAKLIKCSVAINNQSASYLPSRLRAPLIPVEAFLVLDKEGCMYRNLQMVY
ncbi:hypothetical protein BCV71DRAFT_233289 [Rhizopus microsporus]|uniref:Uncharacterized protein n=1 Tax=Rhizopus microsporus TaxID=58291 RepID=A0A1X0S7L5_RHIZD|nr:hypothetical protein BCV71DRAFT_233289 [Rhizopus microsporus]